MNEGGGQYDVGNDFKPDFGPKSDVEEGRIRNAAERTRHWLSDNSDAVARTAYKASMAVTGGLTTYLTETILHTTQDARIASALVVAGGAWRVARHLIEAEEQKDAGTDDQETIDNE